MNYKKAFVAVFAFLILSFSIQAQTYVSEDFEGVISGLPTGWTSVGPGEVAVRTSNAHGGTRSLRFSASTSNVVALPELTVPVNTTQVTLWTKAEGNSSGCGSFQVGYLVDPSDANSFIAVETVSYVDCIEYQELTVPMYDAPAGSRIAFRHTPSYIYYFWYCDDVTVEALPNCMPVTNLSALGGYNAIMLSWIDDGNSNNYTIINMDSNDTLATAVPVPSYTVQNLVPSTTYTFGVVSNCSDTNVSPVTIVNTQTACTSFTIPYDEGFESGVMPPCWAQNGAWTWRVGVGDRQPTTGSHTGSHNILITSDTYEGTSKLITPKINLSNLSVAQLSFWHIQRSWAGDNDKLKIYYRTSEVSPWVLLVTYTDAIENWTEEILTLPNVNATYQLAFEFQAGWGNGVGLDDIHIEAPATCTHVLNLTATATSGSVTLEWTDTHNTGATYTVYNANSGNVLATNISGNTYTVAGLAPATNYQFSVVANCSATESSTAVTISVQTDCGVFSIPFHENFNSLVSGIPVCWDNSEGTTTISSFKWNYYETGYNGAGLRFNSYVNPNGSINVLSTPPVAVNENAILSFWCKNPDGGDFTVLASVDTSSTRDTLITNLTNIGDWMQVGLPLDSATYTGHNVTIYFQGTSNYGDDDAYIYLDKVSIVSQLSPVDCEKTLPYSYGFEDAQEMACWTVHATSSHTGRIEENVEETGYALNGIAFFAFSSQSDSHPQYLISPELSGTENGLRLSFSYMSFSAANTDSILVGYSTTTSDTSAFVWNTRITGIHNYLYDHYSEDIMVGGIKYVAIKSFVDSTYTLYIDSIVIEALPGCMPVTDLHVDNATTTSVTLAWTDNLNDGATYTIYNMADTSVVATNINDTHYTIQGLNPASIYTYAVVVNCSEDTASTAVIVEAMTSCEAFEVPYTEDFEADGNYNCWTVHATSASTGRMDIPFYAESGAGFFAFANSVNPPQYLISPELSGTGAGLQLEFGYRIIDLRFTESFVVGYSTTTNDTSAFVWGTELTDIDNSTYIRFMEEMAVSGIKYVAIKYTSYDMASLLIDSLVITRLSVCLPIADLQVDSVSETTVTLSWEDQGNFDATYSVVYSTGEETIVDTMGLTGTTYTVQDLMPNTTYSFVIRTDCGDTVVNSESVTATTLPQTSISSREENQKWILYPNPVQDKVNVQFVMSNEQLNNVEIQLYDMYGKRLNTWKITGENTEIDLSSYASSVYFIKAVEGQRLLGVRKIVKK